MNKSIGLLFCLGLMGMGVAPITPAQNARSSRTVIIRDVRPDHSRSYYNRRSDYRGRSYYNRRSDYRNSDHDRRYNQNVIIRIDADDDCEDGSGSQYIRGRGQTYYNRNVYPSRYRTDRYQYND